MTTRCDRPLHRGLLLAAALLGVTSACGGGGGGGGGSFMATLSRAVCNPATGSFSTDVTNRFFPLPVGHEVVLDGEEDGEAVHLVITVLPGTEVVAGVPTRIVEEREAHDGELAEVSRNFFVQTSDGTVCYFGEDVDIYENGTISSHEGEWRAGVAGASPGIVMPADPKVGDAYEQEDAPGVAEDRATVTAAGTPVTVPAGTFTDTVTTADSSAIESGTETKAYGAGIGPIQDGPLGLTSSR